MPALIDRVEVPEDPGVRVIEETLRLVWRLDDVDTVSRTVPLKKLRLARVIRLVVDVLLERLTDDGLADMEKSPLDDTVTDIVVEWDNEPLEPFTVTV